MARISYGSVTHNSAYVVVVELNTSSTYTDVYVSCNGQTSPNLAPSSGSSSSYGWTITGLSPNTTYTVSFSLRTIVGSTGSGSTTITTTSPPTPPAMPTGLYVYPSSNVGTIMYADWNAVSGATQYYVTIRQGGLNGTLINYKYVTSPTASFTGLTEYTDYTVTVSAMNANGTGNYNYASAKTIDSVAPIFNTTSIDGSGRIQVAFSAYDNSSGMRSYNTYYVEISNPNGTTYGNGAYQTTTYRTFTSDAYGSEFIHDATYSVRVTAYDEFGNARATTISVIYKKVRPSDWSWTYAKVSGSTLTLSASEWNGFCNRINLFRQYKSLSNYSFTTVVSGQDITATIINQATSAISLMSPPTSPPSLTSAGVEISAVRFTLLRDSLNSIK